MGYVVSRKAAHRYAFESARNTHIPIDIIMNNDIYIGKMYAYIADPPLITLGDTSASSTLDIDKNGYISRNWRKIASECK